MALWARLKPRDVTGWQARVTTSFGQRVSRLGASLRQPAQSLAQVGGDMAEAADDRTLIADEDDGALQAELSALLGEVSRQSELMDRATDADLGADGHDPEPLPCQALCRQACSGLCRFCDGGCIRNDRWRWSIHRLP